MKARQQSHEAKTEGAQARQDTRILLFIFLLFLHAAPLDNVQGRPKNERTCELFEDHFKDGRHFLRNLVGAKPVGGQIDIQKKADQSCQSIISR